MRERMHRKNPVRYCRHGFLKRRLGFQPEIFLAFLSRPVTERGKKISLGNKSCNVNIPYISERTINRFGKKKNLSLVA